MITEKILQKAEKITISHTYNDGTYLLDVLYKGKVYVIRQYLENTPPLKTLFC